MTSKKNYLNSHLTKIILLIITILLIKLVLPIFNIKKDNSTTDSTIVVEKIQKVLKLVTVEGNFSELLQYNDFNYIDFPGFRKKALIKVNAKVLVGYDMNNINIKTDDKNKTITISNLGNPKILAIDHNLSYYDIDNGIFNNFDEKTLTQLNTKAKQLIEKKALETKLFEEAAAQKTELFDMIYYLAKGNGWKIIIENKELEPNITTNKN